MAVPELAERPARAKLLLVDGDEMERATTAAVLSEHFDVTAAADGESALGILAGQRFDVLCAADEAQGVGGRELLDRAAELPHPPRGVLLTGQMDEPFGFAGTPLFQVVFKPFEPQQLIDTVHREFTLAKMRRLVPQAG